MYFICSSYYTWCEVKEALGNNESLRYMSYFVSDNNKHSQGEGPL